MLASLLKRFFRAQERDGRGWLERVTDLQRSGRYEQAAELCRIRLAREPDDIQALQALGAAFLSRGHADEGLAALKQAAALAPGDAPMQLTLARVCARMGLVTQALEHYRETLAGNPGDSAVGDEAVAFLVSAGFYDEAEVWCRMPVEHGGESAHRHHMLARVLFEQGRVEEAIAEFEASLALNASAPAVHSDLLRALNYAADRTAEAVFEAHRAWARRHEDPLAGSDSAVHNEPVPERRLRVGYVSPYFRKHAVTFFLESVIEHYDRARFEIVLYADVLHPDEYSERLKGYGAQWRSTLALDDAALAQKVREDAIDILVDLSGHTPGHRLLAFARRCAPVQVTWNGYPNTTGMAAMDYRITDAACDPPGLTERLHTETLVRLPRIFMSWRPPADAPAPGPVPALASGRITFGSFNACYKLTEPLVASWAHILNELPDARLILFAVPPGRAETRLRDRFADHGIAAHRLEIRPRSTHEAFLEAHREVDIALDSFPYHGTTTTCFSLWMGVPVVSLVGQTHASRVGLTLLSNLGLGELAAPTAEQYIATAIALARKPDALRILRSELRERMLRSPLTDGAACARALERAWREMWRAWCERALTAGSESSGVGVPPVR